MTVQQIRALRPALSGYLDEFADCFVSFDTRYHLKEYVSGQLSDLQRKSVQPIARLMDVPPRTLQEFLSLAEWDHDRLRDRVQQLVTRDHGEAQAIAIVDESGYPKKGRKTACVQRQYCGATGKKDNCVMAVHLAYASFDGQFRAMLDSNLYLPEKGWDAQRRKEVGIPTALSYRPKHLIALEQLRRAVGNGMHFGWVTADEWYAEKPAFIEGLEELKLRFVLEIPKNLMGWVRSPAASTRRGARCRTWCAGRGRCWIRSGYRLTSRTRTRGRWSGKFAAPFWMKRDGRVVGPYWLVAAERSGPG